MLNCLKKELTTFVKKSANTFKQLIFRRQNHSFILIKSFENDFVTTTFGCV